MTKEQEVFERVNRIRIDFFDSKYKDVHTDDELEEKYEALCEVLSMLKEKDKKIESLEKTLDKRFIYVTGARTIYGRLMQLDKETIVQDDLKRRNELEQYINDLEKAEHKNIKQDKIIDLMAEQLAGLTIWNNEKEEPLILPDIEDVKQYFERKSEE